MQQKLSSLLDLELKMSSRTLLLLAFSYSLLTAGGNGSQQETVKESLQDTEKESSLKQGMRTNQVVLRALDKITARVSDLPIALGKVAKFGSLEIIVRFCQKSFPEDPPESIAFLEISERKPGESSYPVFSGWMFSSSPTLSAMEHPVYDIWVKECNGEIISE
jgi:hypothetical protein